VAVINLVQSVGKNSVSVILATAKRLGISDKSLYAWIKQASLQGQSAATGEVAALRGEVAQLKRAERNKRFRLELNL
jgi:transposase-like protein